MKIEMESRRSAAVRERKSLNPIFRDAGTPTLAKMGMVRQVGVGILTANAGTWPELSPALGRTIQSELEGWVRAALGRRRGPVEHIAFDRIRAEHGTEDVGSIVRGVRLRYFRRVALHGPDLLWALLQQTPPVRHGSGRQGNWAGAMREDLCWLRAHTRKLDELPGPVAFEFAPWVALVRSAPGAQRWP